MTDDTIRCECSKCGAKYRLPVEAAGRTARCKRCGETFSVPKADKSLEDSVLDWLMDADPTEADVDTPRVINMPTSANDSEAGKRQQRGVIRMKSSSPTPQK